MSSDKKKSSETAPAAQTAPVVQDLPAHAAQSGQTLPVMYVGPSLSTPFPLSKGDVFSGGLPTLLQKAVREDADLAALFLPIKEAGRALREIERGAGDLVHKLAVHAKTVAARYAVRRK